MTANLIKEVALRLFALKGYEATSLDAIAKEIGIKKQSLYTHIQSKAHLFKDVFGEATDKELSFVEDYFNNLAPNTSLKDCLYRFIVQYKSKYHEELNLRLILYLGFLVPEQQSEIVQGTVKNYFKFIQDKIQLAFETKSVQLRVSYANAAIAYMNLLEGMLVELIYAGPEMFDLRLDASWDIFWQGITCEK